VLYFVARGLLELDADGNFGPEVPITLDELRRFFDYADLPAPGWLTGSDPLLRRTGAELVMRAQGRDFTPDTRGLPHVTFPDIPPTSQYYWIVASVSTAYSFFIDEDGNETWDEVFDGVF